MRIYKIVHILKIVLYFSRLGSPTTDNERTKESVISLKIVREDCLKITEINLDFSGPWIRSERKKEFNFGLKSTTDICNPTLLC